MQPDKKQTITTSLWLAAYPNLSAETFSKVQEFRRQHDELYFDVVKPHFTLVFPDFEKAIRRETWLKSVDQVLRETAPIEVVLSETQIVEDHFKPYWHLFLTPHPESEGFRKIVELHDRLYRGELKPLHLEEIPYIPHVGIANSQDKEICESLAVKARSLLPITCTLAHATIAELTASNDTRLTTVNFKG